MRAARSGILLLLAWLCAAVSAQGQEDGGDSGASIEAAAQSSRIYPEIRKAEEDARERARRWERQRPSGRKEDAQEDIPLEQMLARVPSGPAYLGDLRAEAAEEERQLGMQGIENAVRHRAAPDIQTLYRNYLLQAFGDTGTLLGSAIYEALTTPRGWQRLPRISYRPLPRNIAGLYTGEVFIDPVKGNNLVTVSHEHWHHMGKPDDGPDSAYVHQGHELTGGGRAPNPDANSPDSYSAFQCGG